MKTYEKPRLIAMSLSGNNTLCSSCEIDIVGPNETYPGLGEMLKDLGVTFSIGDSCETTDSMVDAYCKFTAQDSGSYSVFNS